MKRCCGAITRMLGGIGEHEPRSSGQWHIGMPPSTLMNPRSRCGVSISSNPSRPASSLAKKITLRAASANASNMEGRPNTKSVYDKVLLKHLQETPFTSFMTLRAGLSRSAPNNVAHGSASRIELFGATSEVIGCLMQAAPITT